MYLITLASKKQICQVRNKGILTQVRNKDTTDSGKFESGQPFRELSGTVREL